MKWQNRLAQGFRALGIGPKRIALKGRPMRLAFCPLTSMPLDPPYGCELAGLTLPNHVIKRSHRPPIQGDRYCFLTPAQSFRSRAMIFECSPR
jgi:hypothetical protein